MTQAENYIEDILHCGLLDGAPYVQAFVVGRTLKERTTMVKIVGDPEQGRVTAVTFSQLIRTASARLFRIRDSVQDRYSGSGQDLLDRILSQPDQAELFGLTKRPVEQPSSPPPVSPVQSADPSPAAPQTPPSPV